MSIFHKQAIFVSVVVVMTASATGPVCYQFAREQLRHQIHGRLATIADDRAFMLNAYVDQQKERVGLVTSRTKLRSYLDAYRMDPASVTDFVDETKKILRDAMANSSGFLAIRITDKNGRVIAATDRQLLGTDVTNLPEYQQGRESRHLGEPKWVNGRFEANLVGPAVTNDGVFLGVTIVTLDVTHLQALLGARDHFGELAQVGSEADSRLNTARPLEDGMSVLVGTRDGDHVRYLFASPGDEPTLLEDAEAMDKATNSLDTGFGAMRHGDERVLAAWRPVLYNDPEYRAWAMVVQVNADEAYAPVALLGRILLIVLVVLLPISIALAYFIARRSSLPILRLAEAAGDVARGNLERRVPVDSSDEIATLGAAFNLMNQQLDESYRLLEGRVEERTEELARSNRELEQFAYIASHDLQEPLRKIQSFGDLLGKQYSGQLDDQGLDYLRRMQNAATRMRSLINDLLTYARVSTAGRPFHPVDLNDIVQGVLADLEAAIAESSAIVDIGELPTIDADQTQMRQLFQNLVGNALKYRRDGAQPAVRLREVTPRSSDQNSDKTTNDPRTADCCWIEVEDNGIGIDDEDADRVFQPFHRLHARSEYEGTGIGLALCKKIVLRHSGRISLRSQEGVGTTFLVELPRHQRQEPHGEPRAS